MERDYWTKLVIQAFELYALPVDEQLASLPDFVDKPVELADETTMPALACPGDEAMDGPEILILRRALLAIDHIMSSRDQPWTNSFGRKRECEALPTGCGFGSSHATRSRKCVRSNRFCLSATAPHLAQLPAS